jgi:hypothetical protein
VLPPPLLPFLSHPPPPLHLLLPPPTLHLLFLEREYKVSAPTKEKIDFADENIVFTGKCLQKVGSSLIWNVIFKGNN